MFRHKPRLMRNQRIPDSVFVTESKVVAVEKNGTIYERVELVHRDIMDSTQEPVLPTSEEYTLENLLKAGVPLRDIPCGQLLNPTDLEDVSNFYAAKLLSGISANPEQVETLVEDVETPAPTNE